LVRDKALITVMSPKRAQSLPWWLPIGLRGFDVFFGAGRLPSHAPIFSSLSFWIRPSCAVSFWSTIAVFADGLGAALGCASSDA